MHETEFTSKLCLVHLQIKGLGITMARFEIIPGLNFFDREGWGANPNRPRKGRKVARSRRTHVIIHHTVLADSDDDTPNIWERESVIKKNMRRLQVIRENDLGADVPYSFVAYFVKRQSGVVICEGRGEDRTGAHTKGHNTRGIGIAIAGNFESETVAGIEFSKRIHLLSAFLGWLKNNPSHPGYGDFKPMKKLGDLRPHDRRVFVHRDFKNTDCPGALLLPHLNQLDFIDPESL